MDAGPPASVATFVTRSYGYALDDSRTMVIVSFSDLDAAQACALSASLDSAPPRASSQIVATFRVADKICPSGVYFVRTDCTPTTPGAGTAYAGCAEYRRWAAAERADTILATTGTVTIQQSWVDRTTVDCDVDVALRFPDRASFTHKMTVRAHRDGVGAPYCN